MAGAPDCELDVTSVSVCFEDQVGVDEELTESETEEASLSLQRLLTGKNFASVPKPIPIPSHKRRPVVKYEGGKKNLDFYFSCSSSQKWSFLYAWTILQKSQWETTISPNLFSSTDAMKGKILVCMPSDILTYSYCIQLLPNCFAKSFRAVGLHKSQLRQPQQPLEDFRYYFASIAFYSYMIDSFCK